MKTKAIFGMVLAVVFGLVGCATTEIVPPPSEGDPGVRVYVGKIIMIDPKDNDLKELRENSALRDTAFIGGVTTATSTSGVVGLIALDILTSGYRPYKTIVYRDEKSGMVDIAYSRKRDKHQVGDTIKVIRRGERDHWVFNLTRDEITGKPR